MKDVRTDCRHYRGDLPCAHRTSCADCAHHEPRGQRILIIKLGAMGDVLRTTPLLRRLKGDDPGCEITWLTAPESLPLLAHCELVDHALAWGLDSLVRLDAQRFDRLICLDKAPEAAALAVRLQADQRQGFGLDQQGAVVPLDARSEYAVRLGTDDELKFRLNRKTYQQICFEQLGLTFDGEAYALCLQPAERSWAEARARQLGLKRQAPPVGLAIGAGQVFANKTMPPARWAALADAIGLQLGRQVVLLEGPGERALADQVLGQVAGAVLRSGGDHDVRQYAALLERFAAVVSADTLAMHLALAVGTRALALFGPTCAQEVELYGLGAAVVSPLDCGPCYRTACDISPHCMEQLPMDQLLRELGTLLEQAGG